MQESQRPPAPGPVESVTGAARPSTNTDAHTHTNADSTLKRLSVQVGPSTHSPLSQSPGIKSPQFSIDHHSVPRSPGFASEFLQRSASVASHSRSSTPTLGRKSSNSSLRGDVPMTPRPGVSRRSSLNPNMPSPSPNGTKNHILRQVEEQAPLRAVDVAEEYFKKELVHHNGGADAGTLVLIHDQCYGHRFSRPKTTKSHLSLIVERPERILASVMGISAAYVRLGERHCDGAHPPHPKEAIPERVPFRIRKTSRAVDITSPVVTNVHGVKWMQELREMCIDAPQKLASTGKELAREPNPPGEANKPEFHAGDLYLAPESLNAFQGALGGVLDAVDAVFQGASTGTGPSRAFVCIRPPGHHCSDDHPSGFCWINNVHVGIEHAIMQYGLTHAAIIDFDLHHGDGSQAITWSRNKKVQNLSKNTSNKKKTSIGYFSLHDINSYPCEEGDDDKVQAASLCIENAHGQTIWNVHLQPWSTPEEFWKIYEERYMILLEKVRTYLKFHTRRLQTSPNHPAPIAAIFLSAGFDASEWELQGMQRHGVSVPTEFYARFTKDVVRLAEEEGTGVEGRVISVLEGGYSDRALTSGVLSHLSGLTSGQISAEPPTSDGSVFDMSKVLNALSNKSEDPQDEAAKLPTAKPYDPHWWHVSQLTELEELVHPPPPKPKKPRTGPLPTYCSPTQSFTAKLSDPTTYRRSVSGNLLPTETIRGPTPPPPDVEWATATHALSKILIPSDRQTTSCKHGELAEVKVKKEKPAPALASVHVDPSGRQLRGRKAVATYADPDSDHESVRPESRPESRVNRRRTMAALPTPTEEAPPVKPASRRMSIASTTSSVNGDRSQSRASSAVPGRRRSVAPAGTTAANEVQIKKPRSTTTAATRIPKNRPPVPRVPSGYSSKPAAPVEKENEMDELTTGLKRIKLKLPSKEEHDAREKQKALDAAKKASTSTATKTTTRRPAAPRTKSGKTETTTTKKSVGRPSKVAKSAVPAPVEPPAPTLAEQLPTMPKPPTPEAPKIESAVTPPLEAPQPLSPEIVDAVPKVVEAERITPTEAIDPPTELREIIISPDQLPKPAFMKSESEVELLPKTQSPPRPDTPPPPAPSIMPSFVNYTAQTFGATVPARAKTTQGLVGDEAQHQIKNEMKNQNQNLDGEKMKGTLQWVHATMGEQNTVAAEKGLKRQNLPVFSANGVIPFASGTGAASAGAANPTSTVAESKGKAVDGDNTTVNDVNRPRDIWEVPETPTNPNAAPTAPIGTYPYGH